jgi:hypothetical protein
MKVILILGLVLGFVVSLTSQAAGAKKHEASVTNNQNVSGLEVSVISRKSRYKVTDQIQLDVMLSNSGKEAVYIFGTLDWGYSASFVLHISDASGKDVQPRGFFDDPTFTSPDDKSAFVKLLPHHFLGTNFFSPLDVLNLDRPGRYAIYVEYQSPFSATDVQLHPFWGKENGRIKSKVVNVEIVR